MSWTTPLSTPQTLRNGVVVKNRFMKSALSEQMGDRERNPTPELATLYRRWAQGGAGLLVSGNIMIDRTAIGEPFNVVLDGQSDVEAFQRWTAGGTENGTHFWAQLNHPGKQCPNVLVKEPVAPSAIGFKGKLGMAFNKPRALTDPEIEAIIARFAEAAGQAKAVGFTGVQIHGAHGYLVSQFLSPRHNQREDRWGGPLENRMRFVIEVYRAIRAEVGAEFPVGLKLNSADFQRGGFDETESMQVVEAIAAEGVDLLEISGGTYEKPKMLGGATIAPLKESTRAREAFFIAYAEQIRTRTDVPLAVTGGFRSAQGMSDAVECGATDMVGVGRPFTLDPDLPNNVLADQNYKIDWTEPTTGSTVIDLMSAISITWYEKQMWRIGRGEAPQPKLSSWGAVRTALWGMLTQPKIRRA